MLGGCGCDCAYSDCHDVCENCGMNGCDGCCDMTDDMIFGPDERMTGSGTRIDSRAWTGLEPTWCEDYGGTRADAWANSFAEWKYSRVLELKALAALWGPAVPHRARNCRKGWNVYDGHVSNRDEEWTFFRAVWATGAIITRRCWGQRQIDRARERFERRKNNLRWDGERWEYWSAYPSGRQMSYWDSWGGASSYGHYAIELYPGCRISIYHDGESGL